MGGAGEGEGEGDTRQTRRDNHRLTLHCPLCRRFAQLEDHEQSSSSRADTLGTQSGDTVDAYRSIEQDPQFRFVEHA